MWQGGRMMFVPNTRYSIPAEYKTIEEIRKIYGIPKPRVRGIVRQRKDYALADNWSVRCKKCGDKMPFPDMLCNAGHLCAKCEGIAEEAINGRTE